LDRLGYFRGDDRPVIVDLKTGGLYEKIGTQVYGGYRLSYNEMVDRIKKGNVALHHYLFGTKKNEIIAKVERCVVVNLPRKAPGELKVKEYTHKKYEIEFKSIAKLFHSMRR